MQNPTWTRAEQSLPWPWVAVMVRLHDGRRLLAVWTGHLWWGDNRELRVAEWQASEVPPLVHDAVEELTA
jgi:hypothetical protein